MLIGKDETSDEILFGGSWKSYIHEDWDYNEYVCGSFVAAWGDINYDSEEDISARSICRHLKGLRCF